MNFSTNNINLFKQKSSLPDNISNNTINNILHSELLPQNNNATNFLCKSPLFAELYTNIDSNIERLVEKVINFDKCGLETNQPVSHTPQHQSQKQLLVENLIKVNNDLKQLLTQITNLYHNSKEFEKLKLSFDILNNQKIQLENTLKNMSDQQDDKMVVDTAKELLPKKFDNDDVESKNIKTDKEIIELRNNYTKILNENKTIKSKIKDYTAQKDRLENLEKKYKKLETENDKKNLEITKLQDKNKKLENDLGGTINNPNLKNIDKKIKTEQLSNENERIEIEYEKIKNQNAKLEQSNKHLSSLYNNLLKTYNSIEDKNKQLLAQNDSHILKLDTIANENAFLINELKAKHEKEMTDLKTIMINKCDLVNNKNSKLEDEIKELTIENKLIKKNNNDNDRLVTENKNLVEENHRLGIINKNLENTIKTFRNRQKTSKN